MMTLAPSVYAADHANLRPQVRLLEECGVTRLHVDVMDGKFVALRAFGTDTVRMLREFTDLELDVHLMIENPEDQIEAYAAAGADSLTVHYEACSGVSEAMRRIHSFGMEAGLALSPCTLPDQIGGAIFDEIDVLHIMTKPPGTNDQPFIPEMYDRVRRAKELISLSGKPVRIEVDGDVTLERLGRIIGAGAEIIVAGSAFFRGDIRQNVKLYMETGMSKETLLAQGGWKAAENREITA